MVILGLLLSAVQAWVPSPKRSRQFYLQSSTLNLSNGRLHGQDACFLPLEQLDQEYRAPRILQIAGMYPGLSKEDIMAVSSEPAAEVGQWSYDFSDPDGPQMGTVAVPGGPVVSLAEDPIVIIADHFELGIPLPEELKDPVDILVVVDRYLNSFAERKFLVVDVPGQGIRIGGFPTKNDLPKGAEILGQVVFVQIPWLPCMKKTKSGFVEEDELF